MKASSRVTLGTDSANTSPLVPGAPRNSVVVHKHPALVELKKKVISWRDSRIDKLHEKNIFKENHNTYFRFYRGEVVT